MNNILITSAGRRVSLVKFFKKELKAIFPEAKVYGSDMDPNLSSACMVADDYFEMLHSNHEDYIDTLIKKCNELGISLIIPTIDTSVLPLAQNKKLLSENNITVVVPDEEFIAQCRDKRMIHDFFESKGINVAEEYSKNNFQLPIYIKPYDGSSSIDNFLIKDKDELTEYHYENKKLMFLEYLDHNLYDEFTCDLYYTKNGNLRCAVPRQRLLVRAGEVNKGITKRNELVPFIKKQLKQLVGIRGCLTVQFFMHKESKEIYGIEVNPRFGGGYPLTHSAGANYVQWILKEYLLGEDLTGYFDEWDEDLLMLRYDAEVLVHEYKD
ncbi:ATP-grasp domain-containing protein [Maribacter sp. BPC-D8]|uniref:ATP-grasp domain-containing protein n=1 Tax=Maribacter sp. BPC-D8 TaxID=3053613 RepID=UPI002B486796|nr:ATP-grasp domain-containing protein [Maribacter sp. BPC-D8]WRI31288.1 ATP-grasp domain-containing protein [Maribacter sp. BPC-D8]